MACYSSNSLSYAWKSCPQSLLGWNFGNSKNANKPQPKYHAIDLPFPTSLVGQTFLKGTFVLPSCCCFIDALIRALLHENLRVPIAFKMVESSGAAITPTVDGFSATDFHDCSDFKGPCVIIGYTNKAFKFGAFNPEGYRSTDDYYDTFDAFLFYWTRKEEEEEGDADDYPIVLPKVGGSGAALFDYARGGPQFGADGLLIGPPLAPVMGVFTGPDANSGIGDLRQARSRLGLSYAKRPDGKESLFGGESKAILDEVLVFCSPQIASLY